VTRGGEKAFELARRALVAGPDNSTCLAAAAFAYANVGRRYEEAIELAERAIELHPNSAFVRTASERFTAPAAKAKKQSPGTRRRCA